MKFEEALQLMREGNRVGRSNSSSFYTFKNIVVLNNNTDLTSFEFTPDDIASEDWEVKR